MPIVNGIKYACKACINGHRTSSCQHSDRELFEIKKKGRPVSQCEHCRTQRKTNRVHSKCKCNSTLPRKEKKNTDLTTSNILAELETNALSLTDSDVATLLDPLRVEALLNPCDCLSGNPCVCCRTDPKKMKGDVQERNPRCVCPPGGCQPFSFDGCRDQRPPSAGYSTPTAKTCCANPPSSGAFETCSRPTPPLSSPWQLLTPAGNVFAEADQTFGIPVPEAINVYSGFASSAYPVTNLISDVAYQNLAYEGMPSQTPLYAPPEPNTQRDFPFAAREGWRNSHSSYQPEAPLFAHDPKAPESCCSKDNISLPNGASIAPAAHVPDLTLSSPLFAADMDAKANDDVDDNDAAAAIFDEDEFSVPFSPNLSSARPRPQQHDLLRPPASPLFRDPSDDDVRNLKILTSVYASVGTCGGGGSCCGGLKCSCVAGTCQCGTGSRCDVSNRPERAAETSSWSASSVMNAT